jgi:hypothetical protein
MTEEHFCVRLKRICTTCTYPCKEDVEVKVDMEPCDMGQMCLNCQPRGSNGECPDSYYTADQLAAAVTEERERCAKAVEEYETENDITATWLNIIAATIRSGR